MAGSRRSFEINQIQLHQVLMARTARDGGAGFGLATLFPATAARTGLTG
jgi:hypothetical protein